MLEQRSDPDRTARLLADATRLRYASLVVIVLLALIAVVTHYRYIDSLPTWVAVGLYGLMTVSRREAILPLPIKTEGRRFLSLALSGVSFAILVVIATIQFGAPALLTFVVWAVLAALQAFRSRFELLAVKGEVESAHRLSVTMPLVDETGARFRQSDLRLDIEARAGVVALLGRVQGVLKLVSVDVRDDMVRAVSLPVFKVDDLPQLWESLRRNGVLVDGGEGLTMDSADGAVIYARG